MMILIALYMVAMQYFWPKPAPQQNQTAVSQKAETAPVNSSNLSTTPAVIDSASIGNVPLNNNITIENSLLKLKFSNQGGNITSIVTKNYKLSDKKTDVELIPDNAALMDLKLQTASGEMVLSSRNLKHEIIKTDSASTVIFFIEDTAGKRVFSKVYTLGNDYKLDFKIINENFTSVNGYNLGINSGINLTENSKSAKKDKPMSFRIISQINNKFEVRDLKSIKKYISKGEVKKAELSLNGHVDWAAVRSKYFTFAIIPEKRIESNNLLMSNQNDSPAFNLNVKYSNSQTLFEDKYQLYLGPIDYKRLESYKNGMEDISDLSGKFIGFLKKGFYKLIIFMSKYISNFGIVIIIFAIMLKILLTPLTNKSLNSAKKMQEINPLMKEIQQKYKNDPMRMNQELKLLYKTHKVSPMSGCLPLLLQMPIFFALYPVLRYSIELRQTNFVGWLTDLSEPDSLWILPILMGVSMFFQQKLSMANTSPEAIEKMDDQQKAMLQSQKMMMYFMPIMMVWIFAGLPSGLVLYWMVFNVLQIAQQLYQNYKNKKAFI
jgi:YidC/Oxa1 family membrane protein insertase